MNFVYSKSYRLLTKEDFSNLKTDNKVVRSRTFLFFFKPNSLDHSRLGLSVSRKVGNAVVRNMIKRLSREMFRNSPLKEAHFDIHLVARHPSGNLTKVELWKNLNHIFKLLSHEII